MPISLCFLYTTEILQNTFAHVWKASSKQTPETSMNKISMHLWSFQLPCTHTVNLSVWSGPKVTLSAGPSSPELENLFVLAVQSSFARYNHWDSHGALNSQSVPMLTSLLSRTICNPIPKRKTMVWWQKRNIFRALVSAMFGNWFEKNSFQMYYAQQTMFTIIFTYIIFDQCITIFSGQKKFVLI